MNGGRERWEIVDRRLKRRLLPCKERTLLILSPLHLPLCHVYLSSLNGPRQVCISCELSPPLTPPYQLFVPHLHLREVELIGANRSMGRGTARSCTGMCDTM